MNQQNNQKLRDDMMFFYGQLDSLMFLNFGNKGGVTDLIESMLIQYQKIVNEVLGVDL